MMLPKLPKGQLYKVERIQPNGKRKWEAPPRTSVTDFAESVPLPKASKPKR